MALERWKPEAHWTREDKLLHEYWLDPDIGGILFTEVQVGGQHLGGCWPAGSKPRRIDAVRVLLPHGFDSSPDIIAFGRASPGEFERAVTGADFEIIEVKQNLDRLVIGQVLVAQDMLERQYGMRPTRLTIVCAGTDPGLEWVCEKRGIKVQVVSGPTWRPSPPGPREVTHADQS